MPGFQYGLEPKEIDDLIAPIRRRGKWTCRRARGTLRRAQYGLDLAERLGAGLLDRVERDPGLVGLAAHEVQTDAGPDVDQREVVAEHVVQFGGDP